MSEPFMHKERRAGVLIPLFSLRTRRGWGIGEFPDLGDAASWLAEAGMSILQLLPLGETATSETSPYGALTAFGLDPTYLALDEIEELPEGCKVLPPEETEELGRIREAPRVAWHSIRRLKRHALRIAFERFREGSLKKKSARAKAFERFREEAREWLEDYAMYRAIRDEHHEIAWTDWPEPLRNREPAALSAARERLADAILYHEYVQWLCDTQLRAAKAEAARHGVLVKGDLPFMVSGDSADVWTLREEFRTDVRLGAPPDQFSADGQDWGLPVYNWEAMERSNLSFIRRRAARAAMLYDMFRLDHVVGFYRQFVIPPGQRGSLVPAEEAAQVALGERVLRAMQEAARGVVPNPRTSLVIVAEDLGVVPPWVRHSLAALGIPGTKVMRWEKHWEGPEKGEFLDPASYPEISLCTTGTHDTSPVAVWYEEMDAEERAAFFRIPAMRPLAHLAERTLTPEVHAGILGAALGAASALCVLPIQDIFGTRDRINTPSTVGPDNWVYRLPMPLDALRCEPSTKEKFALVRRLCEEHHRIPS